MWKLGYSFNEISLLALKMCKHMESNVNINTMTNCNSSDSLRTDVWVQFIRQTAHTYRTENTDGTSKSSQSLITAVVKHQICTSLQQNFANTRVVLQALPLSLCHQSDEQLVHALSSAGVARRLMLIAKRYKWQFVVKT